MGFQNKGYEIVQDFITESQHQHYLDICEKLNHHIHYSGNQPNYSWNTPSNINKIMGACNFEPEFLKLASHPTLVKIAK